MDSNAKKIYGETTTVVKKSWGIVMTDFNEFRDQYVITTSSGNKYEVVGKTDWDIIEENDEVRTVADGDISRIFPAKPHFFGFCMLPNL